MFLGLNCMVCAIFYSKVYEAHMKMQKEIV
jgi:hypothetical protein